MTIQILNLILIDRSPDLYLDFAALDLLLLVETAPVIVEVAYDVFSLHEVEEEVTEVGVVGFVLEP